MPIYEYACKNCDHLLDALQKMSDDPLVDCPECGKPRLKRLISAPRFRLKGQGWYETDFKKDNQRNLSTGDDKSDKADKSDKTDKSDKFDKSEKSEKKSGDSKPQSDSKKSEKSSSSDKKSK